MDSATIFQCSILSKWLKSIFSKKMRSKFEAKFHLLDQIEKKRWVELKLLNKNNLALTKNYVKLFNFSKTQNHEN